MYVCTRGDWKVGMYKNVFISLVFIISRYNFITVCSNMYAVIPLQQRMHNTHTCVAAVVMETPPNVMRRIVTSKLYSFKMLLSSKYRNTCFDCVCPYFIQYLLTTTCTAYVCKVTRIFIEWICL